ncbi:MAG: flagellar type III secretion system pore protein FliP [Dehalococcoidia bacterium]
MLLLAGCVGAPVEGVPSPKVTVEVGQATKPADAAVGLQIVLLLTVLALAPALLIMVTSFTRTIVVLGFVRSAIGVPQLPPNQVLIGLALFLTFFTMAPVWSEVNAAAIEPYTKGTITQSEAITRAIVPVRSFMVKNTREKDLALFVQLSKAERPKTPDDLGLQVVVPAFIISELRTAFQMGFFIFIPFLVIDLVVSSSLMSMGMMMLPPSLISLPFKVLLFVLADGWYLITRSLVASFV